MYANNTPICTCAMIWECAVPDKIHTHPTESHRKFLGGERVLKAKILEAKYEATVNWNFQGGARVQNKRPSVGGGEYGYFLKLHNALWSDFHREKINSHL